MIWKILIIANLVLTSAIYALVLLAVNNIKKKKKKLKQQRNACGVPHR